MPSANMFFPRRASATMVRHSRSIGTSYTLYPDATSRSYVSVYESAIFGSASSRHMLSRRMMQPGLSSSARTRPSRTCSLNATTRSVSSPPLVTLREPSRMRLPLAPATLRAGGRISAGMISTVHTPLPMRAAIEPSAWPQRCAPSPESLMISTTCCDSVVTVFAAARRDFAAGLWIVMSFMSIVASSSRVRVVGSRQRVAVPRPDSRDAHAHEIALAQVDAEQRADAGRLIRRIDVAQAQVRLHAVRRLAPGAHRLDHRCGAGDDVAARKHAGDRRLKRFVGRDVAPFVEGELRRLSHDRIGVGADREDDEVALDVVLAASHRNGTPPSRRIRLAELHAHAAHRAHAALAVVENLHRIREPVEVDAFFLGVMHFLGARWTFRLAAPVDARHLAGAQTQTDAQRVHRRVARADDRDVAPERQRRVVGRKLLRSHQVAPREHFVRRQHAVQRIAGDAEHRRIAGAGADEHRIEAELVHHLLDREQAADQRVAFELDAELRKIADFGVDHVVRQPEVRDAVAQHAARLVKRLEHRDVASRLRHVGGARHAGGTRADDADAKGVLLDVRDVDPALANRGVADEALEPSDRDRLQRFAHVAHAFALVLLRTYATAHRRQQIGAGDGVVRAAKILFGELLDEIRNVDADRAAGDTRLLGTHQAAFGFIERFGKRVAAVDFGEVLRALARRQLAHRRAFLRNRANGFFLGHVSTGRGRAQAAATRSRRAYACGSSRRSAQARPSLRSRSA